MDRRQEGIGGQGSGARGQGPGGSAIVGANPRGGPFSVLGTSVMLSGRITNTAYILFP